MKRPRQMKVPEPQPEAASAADYGLFEGDEEPPNLEQDRGAEQHGHYIRSLASCTFGFSFRCQHAVGSKLMDLLTRLICAQE